MTTIHGKIWGSTRLIFRTANVEVRRIAVVAGGYCSEHQHQAKSNRFFVESGKLDILVWRGGEPDVTHLEPGLMTDVEPRLWHQFRARSAVVAYEIYEGYLVGDDIERRSPGGVKPIPGSSGADIEFTVGNEIFSGKLEGLEIRRLDDTASRAGAVDE